jgi:hypothetical protein
VRVLWDTVKTLFIGSLDIIKNVVNVATAFIRGDWEGMGTALVSLSTSAMAQMRAAVTGGLNAILAIFGTSIDGIKSAFTSVDWGGVGSAIVQGIANGLSSAGGAIAGAARDAAQSALDAAKGLLGISSPSKVFEAQVGFEMGAGMALGLKDSMGIVGRAVDELVGMTLSAEPVMAGMVSPVASPAQQQTTINNMRVLNLQFSGNYSSQPNVTDQSDLLGLLAGYA